FEAWIGQLDAEHASQSFADIVSRNGRVLLLQKVVLPGVLVGCLCQRRAEAGPMRAAIRVCDRIRKRQNLVVIAVVVLQYNIDKTLVALSGDNDWLGMQNLFVLAKLLHEFLDTVLV